MAEKPDLALILDAKAPKKKRPPPMMAMDDEDDAMEGMDTEAPPDIETTPELEDAAGAVSAALASRDNAEIARTLKGFFKLCGDD